MLSYEREGNTHRIYKNGTLADTATTANKQDSGTFSVGKNGFGDFDGYIDEVRVSDTARYTGSSFTEPTSAFIVDESTDVLLHFDGTNGSTTITNAAENIPVTVSVSVDADLVGQSLTSAQGSLNFDAQENIEGVAATTTIGSVNVTGQEDVIGLELTTGVGATQINLETTLVGQSAATAVGEAIGQSESFVFPTGLSASAANGLFDFSAQENLVGQSLSSNLGSVIISAAEDTAGLQMTASNGTISITINNNGWGQDSWGSFTWGE
jgi:hypothetical protein